MSASMVNSLWLAAQGVFPFLQTEGYVLHIDGRVASDKERLEAGVEVLTLIMPVPKGMGTGAKQIINAINTGKKVGSAAYKSMNIDDAQHYFTSIVDNYASIASKFSLKGGDGVTRDLYQIDGSLRGTLGIFEWIVHGNNVTHRRFIPGGVINGKPNQIVK